VVVAGWLAWGWFQGEEGRVRRRLAALAADASLGAPESEMTRLANAARLRRYFDERAVLEPGEGFAPIEGRETIAALAARARALDRPFRLEFVDLQVAVDRARAVATVTLTARVTGSAPEGGRWVDGRELELTMSRTTGEWLITRARVVEAIRARGR
jgi:hypothetical protein